MRRQKSIFEKHLAVCLTVFFASLICIGAVLLLAASSFYRSDRRDILTAKTGEIITASKLILMLGDISENRSDMESLYRNTATASGFEYTLVDSEGRLICCSEADECVHHVKNISSATLGTIDENGSFFDGTLEGTFRESKFIFGAKFLVDRDSYYIFAACPAKGYSEFMINMYAAFAIISVIGAIAATVILYLVTKSLIQPLEKLTVAAERMGGGDFSAEIDIGGNDEVGRLATALNEMAYSLSNSDESRKSFVANVSHELRTPMTTIGGFVDGILDGTIPEEQHRYYLGIISEEVARLTRLVRSMLNISKFESGEMSIKYEKFDIRAVAVKTVLLFEKKIEEKHADVLGLDGDIVTVSADLDLMQQVIWNLTENAVKFVNEGGYLEYSFYKKDGYNCIGIKNSGDGLDRDEIPRVFDRFYKTDASRGKDKNGVGLGLSIVRSIVKLHSGHIAIRSIKGEYCEFVVLLPIDPQNPPPTPTAI